jgi:hypothetical protein
MRTMSGRQARGIAPAVALTALMMVSAAHGQPPPAGARVGPLSAEQIAPIDLTGYWVSLVTEDWRWRMVVPPRGDYQSVPINEAAYELALKWNPASDEAAGTQCKAYGAAALMAQPGRLNIRWSDPGTLEVRTDAGMQTRLLHFAPWHAPADAPASWQGQSQAAWELTTPAVNPLAPGGASEADLLGSVFQNVRIARAPQARVTGSLKVETSDLLPGYLRKNGLPYSGQTRLTEYWDQVSEQDGTPLMVITSIVHDPVYLQEDWITALHFEKEADGSKWDPQPCSARW